MRTYGEKDSFEAFPFPRKILMDIASQQEEASPCKFRCHNDASSCLTRWSQVCDGNADCGDLSDETNCPHQAALLQSPPNPLTKPSYSDLMEEISGVQICIVAVALVLTLGLITCVINHYNKMGGRSWSGDQRRHNSSRKPKPTTPDTRALYSAAQKAAARKEELLHEHQLQMLSVQRDFALEYPHSVCRPDLPECRIVDSRTCEVPKTYIRPPPNRIVCNTGRVCLGGGGGTTSSSSIMSGPRAQVHKLLPSAGRTRSPSNHGRSRDKLVKNHTSSSTTLLLPHPQEVARGTSVECTVHGWQPPGNGQCAIDLYSTDSSSKQDGDDPPPKYEDVVIHRPQPSPHRHQRAVPSPSSSS